MLNTKPHGKVITFYSFKGGTGRSMALANISYLISLRKKKVLAIDWDLEAPGLFRLFPKKSDIEYNNQLGLIDYFIELRELCLQNSKFYEEIKVEDGWEKLEKVLPLDRFLIKDIISGVDLMTSGKYDLEYIEKVQTFDWSQFYDCFGFAIRSFRKLICIRYPFSLIDSRTGYTDVSGICTMLLPEKLVTVFVPNDQSLIGVLDLIEKAIKYRSNSDDLRPLSVFPLPSKIDDAEDKLRKRWRREYQNGFEKLFKSSYDLESLNLTMYFDEIKIPYKSYYSYGETLAVLTERDESLSLHRAYKSFAKILFNVDSAWNDFSIIEQSEYRKKVENNKFREFYLNTMFQHCKQLSLAGVDPVVSTSEKEGLLNLDSVYTALFTLTPEEHNSLVHGKSQEKKSHRQSALEQLNRHSRLVLLGEPGSGKSTFVNFVSLCFAGELLCQEKINLDLLTSPLPEEAEEDRKPQPWHHGKLLPVRIILRDLAARGLPPVGEKATAEHLWLFIESELPLKEYAAYLKKELRENGGIVLLDGLDEVPDAEKCRIQIKQAVEDFANEYPNCRMMVTSRTYAYHGQDWRLAGFSEAILAPFSEGQVNNFIEHWYVYIANTRGMNIVDASGRAEQLKRAIFGGNRLRALAERPLLLTLMASLHALRGGSLPEKREELYADTVDLLLDLWEKPKTVRGAHGEIKLIQPSLAEWLKVDRDKLRKFINELAFKAQSSQLEIMGTAEISRADLVISLMDLSNNPEVNPAMLVEFLIDRAGILLPCGIKVYTFSHRIFQEYLSACYLTDTDFPEKISKLVRKEPNRWREVALLACAKAVRGTSSNVWIFVDELCYCEPKDLSKNIEDIWGAQIAAEAMVESTSFTGLSKVNQKKVERVTLCLLEIISIKEFFSRERAIAGVNLARIGDVRKEVILVDEMTFCMVPKGEFWMGEAVKMHQNDTLSNDFWITQYPVTQSQFQEFVKDDGYRREEYWKEARVAGIWQVGKIKRRWDNKWRDAPFQYGMPFSLSNHPVVGVSWYEALAFTRWLNEKLHEHINLPKGFHVKLPSEAEWEKAARGGLEIPDNPVISPVNDLSNAESLGNKIKANPKPKRDYPWEINEVDQNNANYEDTGIGATSAVGCFTAGASPYGCEEMSGNVLEWTRSEYVDYPYNPNDGRENLEASSDNSRVLRGGSFGNTSGLVRCAARSWNYSDRGSLVGFRVLLSPF